MGMRVISVACAALLAGCATAHEGPWLSQYKHSGGDWRGKTVAPELDQRPEEAAAARCENVSAPHTQPDAYRYVHQETGETYEAYCD